MKILTVIPYFYPALTYGGSAKVAYDLSRQLSKSDQVTVYTTDAWDQSRRIREKERLKSTGSFKVFYFKNILNSIAFKYRVFSGFGMVFKYFQEKNKFDLVHIHDVFVIPQIIISYIALFSGKDYVVSPHGVLDPVRQKKRSLVKKVVYLVYKPALMRAKALIATSDDEKTVLEGFGFKNVATVYNGVDIKKEKPSAKYRQFHKKDVITFFYVGKIHKLKGLKEFVEALCKVKYKYQLIIAGPDDGGKNGLIKTINHLGVEDKVKFINFVDEKQKAGLFGLTDLFIYPSYSEGFSISILEALKYSVPVLITNECNFDDIKKVNAGYTIDVKKLKQNIFNVVKNLDTKKRDLKKMGGKGRGLLVKKYSIEAMAKNVKKLYS